MVKILLLAAVMVLPLARITAASPALSPASEGERSELSKDEITTLMIYAGRMPVVEQDRKMDSIWANMASDKTPRADFLFCTGLAYLGNYEAQACLGNAFENGRGVNPDLADAYVWYSIALDSPIDDPAARQKIQADRERIKKALLSGSPVRTEKQLADLVRAQKEFKTECLAEIRNTKQ